MQFKNVTFFGFSEARPGEKLYQDVVEVAAEVARAGYTVVNGGGPGVMRASTEGAKLGGGKTIGITFMPFEMTFFEGRDPSNKVDELIECRDFVERTLKLMEYGDVYILFNGGTGTLSELGMAWALARLYFGHHKSLILYGGFWYPIMEEITRLMRIRKEELAVYRIVIQPQDVVPAIKEFEAQFGNGEHAKEPKTPYKL